VRIGLWPYRGPAPDRRFLPNLIHRIEDKVIDPGKVSDLTLPLDQAANRSGPRTSAAQ